jgi:orotidine-5'-phosphate decarboxylase
MNPILVALDVDTVEEARALADQLRGLAGGFKIGSRLFTGRGPGLVEDLVARGDRVFLDLKFHDIPHTVSGAVGAATRLGVWMVNVHAAGGRDMMRAAKDAAHDEAARAGRPEPLVIAVTVLTSLDGEALGDTGVPAPVADHVRRLATLARAAGLDGVVASPHEIGLVREACGDDFTIVTPGVRADDEPKGDQKRTMSAEAAIAAGATYLVVGRPIIAAPSPRAAAERLAAACRGVRSP